LASAWESSPGMLNWNPLCDVFETNPSVIDYRDLSVFSFHWLEDYLYTLRGHVVGGHGIVITFEGLPYDYPPGTVVEIVAFPDEGYRVKAWTGTDDDTSTERINYVTMNADTTVTVEFEPDI